jgi:lysophospholipase L1-like esterase
VRTDAAHPPAPCRVLFVGSSSIARWTTLAQDMEPIAVINRELGGAQSEDVNRWFDQIVAPYRPRAIVFYPGEDDQAASKPVERVVAEFDTFMLRKRAALGATWVYFISLKPSKRRWAHLALQRRVSQAIRARAEQHADLRSIDVATSMMEAGNPKEPFVADGLHMNPQGYALWTQAVRAALFWNAGVDIQSCSRP